MRATATSCSYRGLEAVALQNAYLRALVIPQLGARVWELEDRLRKRQWIWHRKDVELRPQPVGAEYDDVWAGGWEELFPNDAPARFENRDLPDHGEWWAMSWSIDTISEGSSAVLRLRANSKVIKAACIKQFQLDADSPNMSVRYRIRSREREPFHFLFKQHLPVSVTPECRLALPGGRVSPVDPTFGTLLPAGHAFDWPVLRSQEQTVDMRSIRPASDRTREFVYVDALPDGWCGVDDIRNGASLRMQFDISMLPFVWLFITYGGWRDLYTVVLEPCTNMPKNLGDAVRRGQSARLVADQEFTTRINIQLSELESGAP